MPRNIAKQVANTPGVKRFLYVSAAGADPNSPSQFLRTKWIGEQEVKKAFPDVTIFRPCMMYNDLVHMAQIHGKFAYMMKGFNRSLYVIEGQNAKIQPVDTRDVCNAMINSLKMDETVGQTYDLGGPHVYTVHEYYEMLFNIC